MLYGRDLRATPEKHAHGPHTSDEKLIELARRSPSGQSHKAFSQSARSFFFVYRPLHYWILIIYTAHTHTHTQPHVNGEEQTFIMQLNYENFILRRRAS